MGRAQRTASGFVRGRRRGQSVARRSLWMLSGALALVFVAIPLLGENGLATWLRLRSREADLEEEVRLLREQNEALEARLDALANDPHTLEALAREQHNMRAEGEEVLVVMPRTDPDR